MVGSLSAGLLLADEAGAHLPSVDDFLPPEILFQGTPFAINRIILIRIVATIVLLVVLGVTAKRAKLIPGRWQGVVEYGLDFVRDKVVYDVMGIDALSNADQLVVVPDGADTLVQTK